MNSQSPTSEPIIASGKDSISKSLIDCHHGDDSRTCGSCKEERAYWEKWAAHVLGDPLPSHVVGWVEDFGSKAQEAGICVGSLLFEDQKTKLNVAALRETDNRIVVLLDSDNSRLLEMTRAVLEKEPHYDVLVIGQDNQQIADLRLDNSLFDIKLDDILMERGTYLFEIHNHHDLDRLGVLKPEPQNGYHHLGKHFGSHNKSQDRHKDLGKRSGKYRR